MSFDGFSRRSIDASSARIHVAYGGAGPPALLLHGYPQTHTMWRNVAPALAERFTVVCPDLRGYGQSAKPASDLEHAPYSKRAMARDQVEVMRTLGFERFAVTAHDRGARVALRMALDYPGVVERLAVLDIVPTKVIYETIDRVRAATVWRYFFLIQPAPLPERLIGADPAFYLQWTFDEWSSDPAAIATDEYLARFDKQTIHASCEDYRAGATIDLRHDEADATKPVACPVLVLWSRLGLGSNYDVLEIWRDRARDVRGRPLDCGHFLAEELPDETTRELLDFLT
jgi:haloacetate dehalogenase